MAINPEITLDRVQARLKTIKAKYAVPPEEVTYEYLKSLYLLHRRFGEPEKGNPIRDHFEAEYRKLHSNTTKSFFSVMVTGTIRANDPDQYKSVYSNALQYAFDKTSQPQNFAISWKLMAATRDAINSIAKRTRREKKALLQKSTSKRESTHSLANRSSRPSIQWVSCSNRVSWCSLRNCKCLTCPTV